ncbi:MAG: metallophosphoesterase [Spirochaetales bacterium]|nr:metallophosphoesterase [Spirochaetales bacterium]MCF7937713.1 metallophosphoesterase [Spirochaetales bacterium]
MSISPSDIQKATKIVENNSNRPTSNCGIPGGLLDFSEDTKPAIVIGDLHGAVDNLKAIINHEDNLDRLKNHELRVIIVGDGPHNDQTGQMKEMESSLQVMDEIIQLITTYGEDVIYIRGNHDTFDENVAKSAIQQGLEFRLHMTEQWGEEYVDAFDEFFEALPMFVIGKGFVITHAGPVRHGCTRQELIDVKDNPDYYRQLMWNRLHEFRGNPSLKEYGEEDIRKTLKKLNLPLDTPFIVGHNPMWHTGNDTGIWRDIIGIKNHIIIYTNLQTRGPYLYIENSRITEMFARPKAPERFYVR